MRHAQKISKKELISLYKSLLKPRLIEEKMLKLLRQNKISKWFSGIGQEAISVGVTHALSEEDYILPMHRNLGVFTSRYVDLYALFCQLMGKQDGFTQGRERSFHFGILDKNIVGMISHLAAMLPVADGLALANHLNKKNNIVVAFTGDGATSEGDFHEALNLAAVWKLPVIFIIENNGYGLSTPTNQQFACKNLSDKGIGYGIKSKQIDGNNVFEVYKTIKDIRKKMIDSPEPYLIEMKTFRMRGHEEASGTAYIPNEYFEEWKEKDPIIQVEQFLVSKKILSEKNIHDLKEEIQNEFESPLINALNAEEPKLSDLTDDELTLKSFTIHTKPNYSSTRKEKRFVDAITDGLKKAMLDDPTTIIMGQDIAEYGGVFKITKNFLEQFGSDRVRNTPIIESGALGAAYGLALSGFKPIVEMQFSDFISCGFNQIVNNISKSFYRWSDGVNITIRAPHGAGVGAGPFHSQSPEAWFMQHPGLKVLVPSSVQDAQDMIFTAINDPNPVLIFEHKKLYRSLKSQIIDEPRLTDYSKANLIKDGDKILVITYGMGVHWALEASKQPPYRDIGILDLRSLSPIDYDGIKKCMESFNKVLILEEHAGALGPASEVSKYISEYCFDKLDAPILTCSSRRTPVPTNTMLEQDFLASSRLFEQLDKLIKY